MDKEEKIKKVLEGMLKQEQQSKKSWSGSINGLIKILKKKRNLDDRLQYAEFMLEILNAMTFSLNGWYQWCNVYQLNRLSKEEYEEFIPKLVEVAIKWLEIDRDLTSKKEKELQKSIESEIQEEQESSKKYVS